MSWSRRPRGARSRATTVEPPGKRTLRRASAPYSLQCRQMLLNGSELMNALKQFSLRLHAQLRSLQLADLGADRTLNGVDRLLLRVERSLLDLDRSQRLSCVVSLARVRKAGVDESQDCERQSDYLCPGSSCLESATSARFSGEGCGLPPLGRRALRCSHGGVPPTLCNPIATTDPRRRDDGDDDPAPYADRSESPFAPGVRMPWRNVHVASISAWQVVGQRGIGWSLCHLIRRDLQAHPLAAHMPVELLRHRPAMRKNW